MRLNYLKSNSFIILIAILLLFLRGYEKFIYAQLWAEDGVVFYEQSKLYGINSLFLSYEGYLHLIPRLISLVSNYFPITYLPYIYNISTIFIMITVLLVYSHKRLEVKFKSIIILGICCIPHSGEVFGTITNIQWYTSLIPLGLLMYEQNEREKSYINYLLCSLCCFTGPFCFFYAPLFFIKYSIHKSKELKNLFLIVLFCSMAQIIYYINHYIPKQEDFYFSSEVIQVILDRLIGNIFLNYNIGVNPLIINSILMFVILVYFVLMSFEDKKFYKRLLLIFLSMFLLSVFFKIKNLLVLTGNNGDRYFYLYSIVLLIVITINMESHKKILRVLSYFLIALLFINIPNRFFGEAYTSRNWLRDIYNYKNDEIKSIAINPKGWSVNIYPSDFKGFKERKFLTELSWDKNNEIFLNSDDLKMNLNKLNLKYKIMFNGFSSYNGSDNHKGKIISEPINNTSGYLMLYYQFGPSVKGQEIGLDTNNDLVADIFIDNKSHHLNYWIYNLEKIKNPFRIIMQDKSETWGEWVSLYSPIILYNK